VPPKLFAFMAPGLPGSQSISGSAEACAFAIAVPGTTRCPAQEEWSTEYACSSTGSKPWFVGMDMDEPVWAPTVFTKNRDRLLNRDGARSLFRRVVDRAAGLMSDEHFSVDGTLIEAWASPKSFQRKDGGSDGDGRDFRGEERKNDTHASTTDPDARLYASRTALNPDWRIWGTC
jgi:hypothetical protein